MSAEAGSPAPQPAAGGVTGGTAGTAPQVEMQRLWQMYLTLSQELLKFIGREDVDEFLDIVPQRGTVVEKMQALPADVMTAFRGAGARARDQAARHADSLQGEGLAQQEQAPERHGAQLRPHGAETESPRQPREPQILKGAYEKNLFLMQNTLNFLGLGPI